MPQLGLFLIKPCSSFKNVSKRNSHLAFYSSPQILGCQYVAHKVQQRKLENSWFTKSFSVLYNCIDVVVLSLFS